MQNKIIKLLLFIFLASTAFSQQEKLEKAVKPVDNQKQDSQTAEFSTAIPVQSKYSNNFKITYVTFNRRIDLAGRGEIIEFEFIIKNNLDDPQELYIWTVATCENTEKTKSSFETQIAEKDKMQNFCPFPDNLKAFEYPEKNKTTDNQAIGKISYIKYPKDPKSGVNPDTGKPYLLKEKLLVTTKHLSRYRNNYTYFNNFTLLIFDKEGKLVFRQLYELKGWRK
jgi:hypothetical protein